MIDQDPDFVTIKVEGRSRRAGLTSSPSTPFYSTALDLTTWHVPDDAWRRMQIHGRGESDHAFTLMKPLRAHCEWAFGPVKFATDVVGEKHRLCSCSSKVAAPLSLVSFALFLATTSRLYAPPIPICCRFYGPTQPLLPAVSALSK